MATLQTVSMLVIPLVLILAGGSPLHAAQGAAGPIIAEFDLFGDFVIPFVLAIVYTVLGILLFGICIWLVVRIAPFSVRKEIEDDQNIALGIIVGAMILGIAIILAAALTG